MLFTFPLTFDTVAPGLISFSVPITLIMLGWPKRKSRLDCSFHHKPLQGVSHFDDVNFGISAKELKPLGVCFVFAVSQFATVIPTRQQHLFTRIFNLMFDIPTFQRP